MEAIHLGKEVLSHFMRGDMPAKELLSLFVSKVLGLAILGGACITKVPQIMAVVGAKSADGLSIVSTELENFVYLVHAAYGYIKQLPVTAYGESGVMWLQNIILLGLIYAYAKSSAIRPLFTATIVLGMGYLVGNGLLSEANITWLYNMNTFVFMAARLPLIYTAFKQGRTGQLSFMTSFVQFAGGCVRIFTSIKEGGGPSMVRGFVIGSLLNFIVVAQVLYYGKDGRRKKKKD